MKRYKDKDYGISQKLIDEYGGIDKVLESREEIEKFRAAAHRQYEETVALILDAPKNTLNWAHNVAVLIGTARAHRANRELYTIKEK